MGKAAGESVVDASLKVHGIERLRVVDASVFPTVTSANTNARPSWWRKKLLI